MKNLSKLTALLSAAAMTLSLAACSSGNAASTPAPADTSTPTDTAAPSEGATYTVGICQLVTHDALDAATQGFMDALNEALPARSNLTSRTPQATPIPVPPSSTASWPTAWT